MLHSIRAYILVFLSYGDAFSFFDRYGHVNLKHLVEPKELVIIRFGEYFALLLHLLFILYDFFYYLSYGQIPPNVALFAVCCHDSI